MKTNLFLIRKYWRRHKLQFAKIVAAIMFLTALVTVSLLIERTELRRELQGYQYLNGLGTMVHSGNLSDDGRFTYNNLISDEQLDILRADDRVERVGKAAIFGKVGDARRQYTCGAYYDDNARELENLELIAGHFPERSGEATIHDYIAENLFFEFDPKNVIGKEITLDLFGFEENTNNTGEKLGEITVKIVGVIKSSPNPGRSDKEYYEFFNNGGKTLSTPVVYLYHEDVQLSPGSQTYAYIEYAGADVYTEEFYREYDDFTDEMLDKGLIIGHNMEVYSVTSLVGFAYHNSKTDTKIYPSDTTAAIRYFTVLAVVISSIALFGVLYPIITRREKSLDTMRSVGASNRRKYLILFTEALMFLIVGVLAGYALSAGVYELILLVQKKLLGLPYLRAYTAEWCVERVSENPFVVAVICSAAVLMIGYMIYFLSKRKGCARLPKRNAKPRSRGKLLGRMSGTHFANFIQGLLVCTVVFTCTFGYCYSTTNGKGNSPWFRSEEFNGDSFFKAGIFDLREIEADAAIYCLGGSGAVSVRVDRNTGITTDEALKISGITGVTDVRCFAENTGFTLVYPKNSENIPDPLVGNELEWLDGAEQVLPIYDYNYYETAAFFLNDTVIDDLKNYVTEGAIGQFGNGITELVFEGESPSFNVGERVQTISIDNQYSADVDIFEREAVVEAIVLLPESEREKYPAMYEIFGRSSYRNIKFAAPQANTEFISPLKSNYDYTVVKYVDNADEAQIFSQIKQSVLHDQAMKISTLAGAQKNYSDNLAAHFTSIISIIAAIFLMMTMGFYAIIDTRLESRKTNFATLRALGLSRKDYKRIFVYYTLRNTVFGCISGIALSYAAQSLIYLHELKCLSILGADGDYSTFGLDEIQMAFINNSEHYLLLDYEMQYVPIIGFMLLLSGIMLLLSAAFAFGVFSKSNRETIMEQLNEKERDL